jgi:hypothetical protein
MTKEIKTPETLSIPIYYCIDEDGSKIYDFELMQKEFEFALFEHHIYQIEE